MTTSENGQNARGRFRDDGRVMELDRDVCYRALETRDTRFDGLLFVGVCTTGIYCRPICPARTPKAENCRFFTSAPAAQAAGFRPCLRCRPEISPDLACWRGTSNTVSRALDLIAEGALDEEDSCVEGLAGRLGVGERQLRRLFLQHVGATPLAIAQARRVLFAKQLIHDTKLPMTEVAMAAGFGSVRRFNATFQQLYGRPPRELRRGSKSEALAAPSEVVKLKVGYRPPYDWESLLRFLATRAITGVEVVEESRYRRTVEHKGRFGVVEVQNDAVRNQLIVSIRFPDVRALPTIARRVRRVFDTSADIETVTKHLARDPGLATLVAFRPGLRAPGGWDGFELAVRAMLGQQITVEAARVLAGKLATQFGAEVGIEITGDARLSRIFPAPDALAAADLSGLGMPKARIAALSAMAQAAAADPSLFARGVSLESAVERLRELPGIGDWTAHYIALRALRETDAFPASDLGLLRGAEGGFMGRLGTQELLQRAEAWRPWRAYAAQHLWASDEAAIQAKKKERANGDERSKAVFIGQDSHANRHVADRL